jgi:hypothetical protein
LAQHKQSHTPAMRDCALVWRFIVPAESCREC